MKRPAARLRTPLTLLVLGAVAVFAASRIAGRIIVVKDAAMLLTLFPGDRLLVAEGAPLRGEIVRYDDAGTARVARLIALPGERVAIAAGRVSIDGRPLIRFRVADRILPPGLLCPVRRHGAECRLRRYREMLPGGLLIETTGPPATITPHVLAPTERLLLTDNRAAPQPGIVAADRITGRVTHILVSLDRPLRWSHPASWPVAFRRDRMLMGVEPVAAPR